MKERVGVVVLILVVTILTFAQPSAGWWLQRLFTSGVNKTDDPAAISLQNQVLQAQVAALETIAQHLPTSVVGAPAVFVYSRYPFNFKNELLVNAGANQGIAAGQSVVVAASDRGGVLVGEVEKVFTDSALVRTLFDKRWQSAVRVGVAGTDALLVGGLEPRVTLIPTLARVAVGDIIYNADPAFPYALAMGTVKSIDPAPDKVFREAGVTFGYDINAIQAVSVLTKYKAPPRLQP